MPLRPNGLPRAQRLKRRRLIRPLFARDGAAGRIAVGCVQVLYRTVPREASGTDAVVQIGFAPGRRARTKVGRNRLKRLMRDAYRHHQHPLLAVFAGRPDALTAFVVFRGNEDTAAEGIRRDVPELLRRLTARLRPGESAPP